MRRPPGIVSHRRILAPWPGSRRGCWSTSTMPGNHSAVAELQQPALNGDKNESVRLAVLVINFGLGSAGAPGTLQRKANGQERKAPRGRSTKELHDKRSEDSLEP